MAGQHPLFELSGIETAGFTAGLTLDQGCADRFDLGATFLFASDQITDVLAVVGIVTSVDLSFDPVVLLISKGDGFTHSSHGAASYVGQYESIIILLVQYSGKPCELLGNFIDTQGSQVVPVSIWMGAGRVKKTRRIS